MFNFTPLAHGAGPVEVRRLTFSDNQPHLDVKLGSLGGNLKGPIASPADLLELLMWDDIFQRNQTKPVTLTITYLLGARMDRPISDSEPFTLRVITDIINSCRSFERIYIVDPHSDVACGLIRNSSAIIPYYQVSEAIKTAVARFRVPVGQPVLVCPDAGALKKTEKYASELHQKMVLCTKHRDMSTGRVGGFRVHDDVEGAYCMIVDDICDGGGTFVGEADVLRQAGAAYVWLYVTHGIFSKGLPLEGIDAVYTTDSFPRTANYPSDTLTVFKI